MLWLANFVAISVDLSLIFLVCIPAFPSRFGILNYAWTDLVQVFSFSGTNSIDMELRCLVRTVVPGIPELMNICLHIQSV